MKEGQKGEAQRLLRMIEWLRRDTIPLSFYWREFLDAAEAFLRRQTDEQPK